MDARLLSDMVPRFHPKLFTVLSEGYSRETFLSDLQAGLTVGLVALPLAIAFAIASGVSPQRGLLTAIVAGFLISALGGSRVQIGGPTGAFIVTVYAIVAQFGYDGLAAATFLAGLMLIVMGLSGLGTMIKYIPYPVTVGFTSGIAVIIAASQGRDFFGLRMDAVPPDFLEKISAYARDASTANPWAIGIGAITVAITLAWPRVTARIPGTLAGLLAATAAVALCGIPVETIGSRFPPISAALPVLHLPDLSPSMLRAVFKPAMTIAILAAIESLLSAVVADGMTGRRHRSNTELVAQGIANLVSPLFGGIPATGAIARTAMNVKSGGLTPIAGMVHALTLLLIVLFFGRWASLIPLPALAGILLIVAYNMSEWRRFRRLLRAPRSDVAVLCATFLLTVLVDLTVAIEVGMVLAAFLFMRRMAEVSDSGFVDAALSEEDDPDDPMSLSGKVLPPGVEVFEIDGPFFFGAADQVRDVIGRVSSPPRVLILRMRRVPAVDATGLTALEDLVEKAKLDGTVVVFSGVRPRVRRSLDRMGLDSLVGPDNILSDINLALARARAIVDMVPPGQVRSESGVRSR